MDPLSLLRDYTIRKQLDCVVISGNVCKFGDAYEFPVDIPTAYKARTGYGVSGYYTLEMLVVYIKSSNLRHTEYMASVNRKQHVAFVDRKDLKEYLEGVSDSSDAIGMLAPLASSGTHSYGAGLRRKAEDDFIDDVSTPGGKRIRGFGSDAGVEEKGEGEGVGDGLTATKVVAPPVELSDEEKVRLWERPVRSGLEAMCCQKADAFKNVLGMWTRREEERKRVEKEEEEMRGNVVGGGGANGRATGGTADRRGGTHGGRAMMPAGDGGRSKLVGSTLINIFNVKRFLEDAVFAPPENKSRRPDTVIVERSIGRKVKAVYHVKDSTAKLTKRDWERVVAVFVLGKEWQFKEFGSLKTHAEVLNKMLGAYVRYDDASQESLAAVKKWNLKFLTLSKFKRHQDRTAAVEFWNALDSFLGVRKSSLSY